jgi:hypothetical protein
MLNNLQRNESFGLNLYHISSYILWGVEILADKPSRLGGEEQQDKLSIE